MSERFKEIDKMVEVINDDYTLLHIFSRFNLALGFGDKTIKEVCEDQKVDCQTFLAVTNIYKYGNPEAEKWIERVSLISLTNYLKNAHHYFLEYLLPNIRRKLVDALDCSSKNEIAFLILKYYDEYFNEVRMHMESENSTIFKYATELANGRASQPFELNSSILHPIPIEQKIKELKTIIIKYYNKTVNTDRMNTVLYDIYMCEEELYKHCQLEDCLFIPAVRLKEELCKEKLEEQNETDDDNEENQLSEREKDIIIEVVKGKANKEIADHLCISINTVTTHRRNIARKLDIHSAAGLTIYAIANKLVDIKDLNL